VEQVSVSAAVTAANRLPPVRATWGDHRYSVRGSSLLPHLHRVGVLPWTPLANPQRPRLSRAARTSGRANAARTAARAARWASSSVCP